MNQPMPSARDAVHSYGVILHHRLAWWLVDFPQLDAMPLRARKLSGRLTPALAGWLRAATGDPGLVCDVAALNPESRCWAGEFSLVPAHNDAKLFDIDAHPWGAEAGELECRLARTMIDRSEEHTSELQSLMRISYAVFCLKKKKTDTQTMLTYP